MKAIIPVAGSGTRLRPITDLKPKVLVEVAGAPVLEHIINNFKKSDVDELVFVVGVMKEQVVSWLEQNYADEYKLSFVTQDEPLGLGHAIFQAKEFLSDEEIFITIGDEIFSRDFPTIITEIHSHQNIDASVGTMIVSNPSHYGMVKTGRDGLVAKMVEKPKSWNGNTALAGAYYIKKGSLLRSALSALINRNNKGREYQITDALQIMVERGDKISTFSVGEGYDCGRPESLLISNNRMLLTGHHVVESAIIRNSEIIRPCFIGENASITDSKIGPFVSVGKNVQITNSTISQSIIERESLIEDKTLSYSICSGDLCIKRPELAKSI
jgi:glucose-1-phosphate thymidylyltransferase